MEFLFIVLWDEVISKSKKNIFVMNKIFRFGINLNEKSLYLVWRRDVWRIIRVLFGKGYLCVLCSVFICYKLFCFVLKDFEISGVFEV